MGQQNTIKDLEKAKWIKQRQVKFVFKYFVVLAVYFCSDLKLVYTFALL